MCIVGETNKMTTIGWTKDDYKTLHDLKAKANLFNLEVGYKILRDEIPLRAQQMVLHAYVEGGEYQR